MINWSLKIYFFFCLLSVPLFGGPVPRRYVNGKCYVNMHVGGRLGNQMFQVAAALSLAEDFGAQAIFPDFALFHRYS